MIGCLVVLRLGNLGKFRSRGRRRLGRLPEGKSEHYVETERTVRTINEHSVDTLISKCHVCVHRMRWDVQKQASCVHRTAGMSGGPLARLKSNFGFITKEAFVLRTEAACAALAAWDIRLKRLGRLVAW